MPREYDSELDRIKASVAQVELEYDLDFFLAISGDIVKVKEPTGLHSPRVHLKRKTVTGSIYINGADIKACADHAQLLRSVVAQAVTEVLGRIAKKDASFDLTAERAKLPYLSP